VDNDGRHEKRFSVFDLGVGTHKKVVATFFFRKITDLQNGFLKFQTSISAAVDMIHRHHNPQWINPKAERTREAMSEEGFQRMERVRFRQGPTS
jgi:hypothetical protein